MKVTSQRISRLTTVTAPQRNSKRQCHGPMMSETIPMKTAVVLIKLKNMKSMDTLGEMSETISGEIKEEIADGKPKNIESDLQWYPF